VNVRAASLPGAERILTKAALSFVARLHHEFEPRRRELLRRRDERQADLRAGIMPGWLGSTAHIRAGNWRVAAAPADLLDRRVEITGPVERKMMINALNSGAKVFMADFEDALSPTWENVVFGQINLHDAVRGTLSYVSPEGKRYQLKPDTATLVVRPRGWHLVEKHVVVNGQPVSASLFDFGLFFFHNARALLDRGSGPYFYLPKLEHHTEARLWNDVFNFAQDALKLFRGSIRATVLIETIFAAFQMDEILYELRDHAAGLNAGRWDYIFSTIKKFAHRPEFVLPDRAQVTMGVPFMNAYTDLLVRTCHRRGAHAIGGMAAFIPNRNDPLVTEAALAKVREDKERESMKGFDGTWVAHPALVAPAQEIFDRVLGEQPHQKHVLRDDVRVDERDLLDVRIAEGRITRAGVELNVDVALQYIDAWLRGTGAVAIHNLMEDAATAEISRAQLWQWCVHRAELEDGSQMTPELYQHVRNKQLRVLRAQSNGSSRLDEAAQLLDRLVLDREFAPFLTIPGYDQLD
jgi:malate synthase